MVSKNEAFSTVNENFLNSPYQGDIKQLVSSHLAVLQAAKLMLNSANGVINLCQRLSSRECIEGL